MDCYIRTIHCNIFCSLNTRNYLYTDEFLNKLKNIKHPYGNAGASLKIFNILKKIDLKIISQKSFFYF